MIENVTLFHVGLAEKVVHFSDASGIDADWKREQVSQAERTRLLYKETAFIQLMLGYDVHEYESLYRHTQTKSRDHTASVECTLYFSKEVVFVELISFIVINYDSQGGILCVCVW